MCVFLNNTHFKPIYFSPFAPDRADAFPALTQLFTSLYQPGERRCLITLHLAAQTPEKENTWFSLLLIYCTTCQSTDASPVDLCGCVTSSAVPIESAASPKTTQSPAALELLNHWACRVVLYTLQSKSGGWLHKGELQWKKTLDWLCWIVSVYSVRTVQGWMCTCCTAVSFHLLVKPGNTWISYLLGKKHYVKSSLIWVTGKRLSRHRSVQ